MKTLQFQQRAKVGVAGSLHNQLMSNNSSVPEVGKGATTMSYSDRHCYEVIEVSRDLKTVKLESLRAEHDKTKPGGQGHQNWILIPTGYFTIVQWRHNAWRRKCERIVFTEQYSKTIGPNFWKSEDYKQLYPNNNNDLQLIDGKTELKIEWHKINILFGVMDYYYDWEF